MKFNEDSRVKIPTILHLMGLGYEYISLKYEVWDLQTNIFRQIFKQNFLRLNPTFPKEDFDSFFLELELTLDSEDLGKVFFEKLIDQAGWKLIDLENFENNQLKAVTELTYKNGDDEFRPDIILLVNGFYRIREINEVIQWS